ncbi:uncharacterized protein C1orf112 homolog [Gigantopelta aegis]|uniref:uncharacterized protein C1orf112 homolog n=1 Tax=Gigantopelta aegis TaxID=1735272 RepID=UPI001B88C7EA|nr:uncharacterized protein C1orf112 homolog [Gigantopelta aegis]
MSQTTFLENVISWSKGKCEENIDEALPKLIICLGDASTLEESIGILKIVCQTFLPLVKQHEAEEKVFSKISSLTCSRFDDIIEKITEQTSSNASAPQISSLLEMVFNVLDCLDSCITSISSYKDLHLFHIHSLPSCTIHLLKGTYGHCKGSAEFYQDLLGTLSESLSMLFRKAHTVQMAFLNMFDKVIALCNEEDVQDLCDVCEGLFDVCQIVTSLDVKVVVSIWKAISRISSQHKDVLKKKLNVFKMIVYLCQEIKSGYEYVFQLALVLDTEGVVQSQGDEKAFKKSVKILGFYMKILVVFVKDYKEFSGVCVTEVFNLMLDILKMLPPCLSRPKIPDRYTDEVKLNLGDAVGPLLENLTMNQAFIKCVTHETDVVKDLRLPRLLLQIQILDMLPKYSDDEQRCWLHPSLPTEDSNNVDIVTAVFRSAGQCFVELALPVYLPGVVSSGKQQRDVSLYEYVCTKLCGFIGSYPAKYFSVLERSLLQNAFSTNPFMSLLAVDCWCFLVRYGSAELCNIHVMLLCHLHRRIYSTSLECMKTTQLGILIHRLAKFLAPEHQQELPKMFVPCDNLALWTELPLAAMQARIVPDLMEDLVTSCTKILHNWINYSNKTQNDVPHVVVALRCLNNIFSNSAFLEQYVLQKPQQLVVNKVCEMWRLLTCNEWDLTVPLGYLISSLILLSSLLISWFQTSDILQILSLIQKVLSQQASVLIRLSVVKFLEKCGSLKISPSFQQSQILNKIPDVFRTVLLDSNCVVHHEALNAFAKFAEQTIHESVVPQCIGNNAHLQDVVVSFLNKVPYQAGKHSVGKTEYLSSQMDFIDHPQNHCHSHTSKNDTEPPRKRLKMDICPQNDDDYKKVLGKFQSVFTDLQQLSLIGKPPEWFLQSGGTILEQMLQIFNKKTVMDNS